MANLNDIQLRIIVKSTGIDTLNSMTDTLSKVANSTKAAASEATNASGKWSAFGEALGNMERDFDAVFRAASHLQSLGHDLTGMGEAGIGMLSKSVDAWGDYEYELNRAAGALGVFDTMSPIYKKLQKGIDDTAVSAKLFPADQVAHAVYLWGSATGQTVKSQDDLDSVMRNVLPLLKLSAMTNTDLESSMKGIYQITQQYGLGMNAVADVTQKVYLAAQKTTLEVPDLVEAFKYVGASAPILGVKFEDLAQIMTRLGDVGVRGSQSGRGLAQMFMKLVHPTVGAKKALDQAFLATDSLKGTFDSLVFPNGQFIGTTKYIDMMAAATENMTDQERFHLLAMISTQNEARVLIPLIDDQIKRRKENAGAIEEEKINLDEANAVFEGSWKILSNSWKGALGAMQNSLGAVVRLIGASVANMVKPWLEAFSKMLAAVREFLDTHPQITAFIVQFTAIISVALAVAGALFSAVGVLLAFGAGIVFVLRASKEFITIFGGATKVVGEAGAALGQAEGAVGGVSGAFSRLAGSVVKFLGPIGLVAPLVMQNVGGIRDAIANLVTSTIKFLSSLHFNFELLVIPVRTLFDVVKTLLTPVFWALAQVLNIVSGILQTMGKDKGLNDLFSSLGNIVMFAVGAFVAWKAAVATWNAVMNTAKAIQAAYNIVVSAGSKAILFYQEAVFALQVVYARAKLGLLGLNAGMLKSAVITAAQTVKTVALTIATGAWSAATTLAAGAWKLLDMAMRSSLVGIIISAIIIGVGLLYEAWKNNWFGMRDIISTVFTVIEQVAGNILSTVIGVVKNIVGVAASIPGPWQQGAKDLQQSLADMQADIDSWGETVITTAGVVDHATSERLDAMNGYFSKSPMPALAKNMTVATYNEMKLATDSGFDALSTAATKGAIQEQNAIIDARRAKEKDIQVEAEIAAAILPNNLKKFKKVASKASTDMMSGVIQSIYDNFDALDTAWDQYLDHLAKPLDTATEMAKIKSRLTSSELQKGLASKNPIIKADAENMKKSLEAQLLALQNDAPVYAMNTGQNYSDALASQQTNMKAAATTMLSQAKVHMRDAKIDAAVSGAGAGTAFGSGLAGASGKVKTNSTTLTSGASSNLKSYKSSTYTWGHNAGVAFADGIASAAGTLAYQSAQFLNGAKTILQFSSPPEAGPWKKIDKWGENAGQAFADGLVASRTVLKKAADTYLGSAKLTLDQGLTGLADMGGQVGFDQTVDRTLNVKIDVTSKDGTVNSASRDTLKQIFTTEEFVSGLEHMAVMGK